MIYNQDYFATIVFNTEHNSPLAFCCHKSKIFIYLIAVLQVIEARFQSGKVYSWAGIYAVLVLIQWNPI